MSYTILRTEHFAEQLDELILYIAEDSGFVSRALEQLDRIEAAVCCLAEFPDSGALPRYASIRRKGYRILVVGRYLIFYRANHLQHTVMLHAITDERMDMETVSL